MSETENVSKKRWYVLQAFSGFESRVAITLREYIKQQQMEDQFGEVLVPTEEVVENVAGKRRKSERLVKSVPRVMGFIGGTPDKPAPISKREADLILNRLEQSAEKPRHRKEYQPGEEVRVTEGPFADFNGTVEEVDYEKGRLKVSVSIFGRATPVELEFGGKNTLISLFQNKKFNGRT